MCHIDKTRIDSISYYKWYHKHLKFALKILSFESIFRRLYLVSEKSYAPLCLLPPLTSLGLRYDSQVSSQFECIAVVSCQKKNLQSLPSLKTPETSIAWTHLSSASQVLWGLLLGLQIDMQEGVSFPQVLYCICQLHADVSAGPMWHLMLIREQLNLSFVLIYAPGSQSLQSMLITILWVCVIKRLLCLLSDDFRHFLSLFPVVYHHNHNSSH